MKYLLLALLLTGCTIPVRVEHIPKISVWQKQCYPTPAYPYEKCYEYTK